MARSSGLLPQMLIFLSAENQQVAAVTQAAYLGYAPSSGILGLAYPDLYVHTGYAV
jgi:hypothetical protein